jgi:predicted phage-related endonuclease
MTKSTNPVNGGAMPKIDRRQFIGGSDARIIMGQDEKALHRLWQEKRGEAKRVMDERGIPNDL